MEKSLGFSKKEENEGIINNSNSDYWNCYFYFFRIEISKRKNFKRERNRRNEK